MRVGIAEGETDEGIAVDGGGARLGANGGADAVGGVDGFVAGAGGDETPAWAINSVELRGCEYA